MNTTKNVTFQEGVPAGTVTLNSKIVSETIKLANSNSKSNKYANVDVWKDPAATGIDSSRIDKMLEALRTKIETINGFVDDADRAVRKIFASADTQQDGTLDRQEFVSLMIKKMNFEGYEKDIFALYKRFDVDNTGRIDTEEFVAVVLNKPPNKATTVIGRIREILAKRAGGASSLKSLALQFKIMDSEQNGLVSRKELEIGFSKFLTAYGMKLTQKELDILFKQFDFNGDGNVSYDEFIRGIRGEMSAFRIGLVKQAFKILDSDGSGTISLEEIASRYDVSKHPMVVSGQMTPMEAVKLFLSQWSKKQVKEGVSEEDFIGYYEWVSSSIDNDDYFELMMRNAWHIWGGSGWSENTSNLRVLVTHEDGSQTVEGIHDDLGLKKTDIEGIKARLLQQGIKAKAISLAD